MIRIPLHPDFLASNGATCYDTSIIPFLMALQIYDRHMREPVAFIDIILPKVDAILWIVFRITSFILGPIQKPEVLDSHPEKNKIVSTSKHDNKDQYRRNIEHGIE